MDEISKVVTDNEKVLYQGKPNFKAYLVSSIVGLVFAVCILSFFVFNFTNVLFLTIIVGGVVLIGGIFLTKLSYQRTLYVITDKRVIIQSGIIGRDFKSIDYDRIQNVSVKVGIVGIIFKVGTINIFTGEMETVSTGQNTSSMQSKYDRFIYINDAYDVLKKIQTELSKRKENLV
ncbi:MAG: PH domain-containing protein [bacterium]